MSDDEHGDCYESAAEFLIFLNRTAGPLKGHGCLVHGRPTLTRPPFEEYGHAWVELEDVVFEVSNGNRFIARREVYYAAGTIDPDKCLRYTVDELRVWLVTHGHYGPWEGPEGCPPLEDDDAEV